MCACVQFHAGRVTYVISDAVAVAVRIEQVNHRTYREFSGKLIKESKEIGKERALLVVTKVLTM